MINPNYINGRFLFVVDGCQHCGIWEKFIRQFNMMLKPNKRIKIVDCTYYDMYNILTDPIIKLYESRLDGYPVLFIGDARKDGAESVIECMAWLLRRLYADFIFPPSNEFLPTINKSLFFNQSCGYSKGRIVCE